MVVLACEFSQSQYCISVPTLRSILRGWPDQLPIMVSYSAAPGKAAKPGRD